MPKTPHSASMYSLFNSIDIRMTALTILPTFTAPTIVTIENNEQRTDAIRSTGGIRRA
ncbi:hypothetical protein ACWS81_03065 [Psychrobacter celer]